MKRIFAFLQELTLLGSINIVLGSVLFCFLGTLLYDSAFNTEKEVIIKTAYQGKIVKIEDCIDTKNGRKCIVVVSDRDSIRAFTVYEKIVDRLRLAKNSDVFVADIHNKRTIKSNLCFDPECTVRSELEVKCDTVRPFRDCFDSYPKKS